ncbi:MAG TPA: class I SAM-dependent methyltransferase [Burkholderiales bacterium]|jgi:SAM-dependent methyltransferase|nr:class I SAM-dependent methyltransferase [Burkholderiales bacterium]
MKSTFLSLTAACALASAAAAQSWAWDDGTVPFVVSPLEVVDRMLRLAEPRPGELLVDLGSGDGRIVIEAAKRYGARGLGVDIDPTLVARATENARRAGVDGLAHFKVQDFFETDLRGVSVVTMYLLPEVNLKLMPKLLQDLKPGARVVSHDYEMGGWRPDETIELTVAEKMVGPTGRSRVHLWFIPADVRGTWRSELKEHGGSWEFRVEQIYQRLDVTARASGIEVAVRGTRLRGDEVKVVASGNVDGKPWNHLFRGILKGDRIEGELLVSDGENNRTLPWTALRNR